MLSKNGSNKSIIYCMIFMRNMETKKGKKWGKRKKNIYGEKRK